MTDPEQLNDNPAVWHGLAGNPAMPPDERLTMALKACDMYLEQVDQLKQDVVAAAERSHTLWLVAQQASHWYDAMTTGKDDLGHVAALAIVIETWRKLPASNVPAVQFTYAAINVVIAAHTWYKELLKLGHFKPGEASTFSKFRSDRWPPEVDLAAAIEKWRGVTEDG